MSLFSDAQFSERDDRLDLHNDFLHIIHNRDVISTSLHRFEFCEESWKKTINDYNHNVYFADRTVFHCGEVLWVGSNEILKFHNESNILCIIITHFVRQIVNDRMSCSRTGDVRSNEKSAFRHSQAVHSSFLKDMDNILNLSLE